MIVPSLRCVQRTPYSVFAVEERQQQEPQSRACFHVLDCPDWACVVPVTTAGEVVLVRQFRAGVAALTLEPPGGLVEPGQTPEQTAARELLEETGYAGRVELLGWLHPNPAILTNRVHLFAVRDAVRVADPQFDGQGEHCETVVLARSAALEAMRQGAITHVIGLAAMSAALGVPITLPEMAREADVRDAVLAEVLEELQRAEQLQTSKVLQLARRLRPDLTPEDIRNPHDFPELGDPDWHYADGQLTGTQAAIMAVRSMRNRGGPPGDSP
jgi:8-oxo-dGTP pyrophosphatase MutT (NUDIX family)